tara:strand:- start:1529 stop:1699 length:171 start_codon:yes stop_codon:yes gene_type:complete
MGFVVVSGRDVPDDHAAAVSVKPEVKPEVKPVVKRAKTKKGKETAMVVPDLEEADL